MEIDDRLIAEAQRLLRTASIEETIDCALREVLRRDAQRREVQALTATDCLDLADQSVMAKAWRS